MRSRFALGGVLALLGLLGWWRATTGGLRTRLDPVVVPVVPESIRPSRLVSEPERATSARVALDESAESGPVVAEPAPAASELSLTLSGIVLGPDGRPPRLTYVKFVWDDRGRMREVHGAARSDGRFELAVGDRRARGDLLAYVRHHDLAPAALTGVEAGARGLELTLGWPAFFQLEVRDADEQPITSGRPRFYWELAGHRVQDYPGGTASGDPFRWARSPVPFRVDVSPAGHVGGWFGPFDPATVREQLVLRVQRSPRIRGQVVHEGRGVADASVARRAVLPGRSESELVLAEDRNRGRWIGHTKTDADGRFELSYRERGRWELQAFAKGLGEGRVAPFELDGSSDVEHVILEIDRPPGAIEGQVLLPKGRGPEEIWLSVEGRGYRSLRADGSFVLPDLVPGSVHISVREAGWGGTREEWFSITHGPSRAPVWLRPEPVLVVEVDPGSTTRFDLDLTRSPTCGVAGAVRIDGAAPVVRAKESTFDGFDGDEIVRLDRGSPRDLVSTTDLGDDGTFTLGAAEPGPYRLRFVLEIAGSKETQWTVLDRVELASGLRPWELDVTTGSLRVLAADDEHPLWASVPPARWTGPDDVRVFVQYPDLEEPRGSRYFRRVPAGRIRFVADDDAEGPVLLECEIRPGETTETRWPP